jgi:hypothetical protein
MSNPQDPRLQVLLAALKGLPEPACACLLIHGRFPWGNPGSHWDDCPIKTKPLASLLADLESGKVLVRDAPNEYQLSRRPRSINGAWKFSDWVKALYSLATTNGPIDKDHAEQMLIFSSPPHVIRQLVDMESAGKEMPSVRVITD